MKRKILLSFIFLLMVSFAFAQQAPRKFSPEQFDKEMRQFITKEASLTPEEADKFFPVFWEMQKQQRVLYMRQRQIGRDKPQDEAGCKKAVQERDCFELEQKRIQQNFHNKFFEILPASKVYDVIQAEDRFHRHKLRQWGNMGPNKPKRR